MSKPSTLEKWATYTDVAKLAIKYAPRLSDQSEKLAGEFGVSEEVLPSEDGIEFAKDLEGLGPTFVKVGQLLSTRVDLLPPSWTSALQRLQDNVDQVPWEEIREVIENELGVRVSKLFDEIDEAPIASASLGQVHRAKLRSSGRDVAVKVQRPGIREQVTKELGAIIEVCDFMEDHTEFGETYEIGRMARQIQKAVRRELDYSIEARSLERLSTNMASARFLVVPSPYPDYCSTGVLTMDYIEGEKITDLSGVVRAEIEGDRLSEELFSAYLKQILVDGFFHADPHPGNVLLTRDRKLAMIDLGMVGSVTDDLKDQLIELLTAIAEGKSDGAAAVARSMGTPREDFDSKGFEQAIKSLVEERQGHSVKDLQVGSLVMRVTDECGRHGLRIPDAMFLIGKMLMNLDMIGKALNPDFNPDECLRRRITVIARERFKDHLSVGGLVHYLSDLKELFSDTPARINHLLEKFSQNQMSVKVDAIDEAKLLRGFHRVANRITVGLILAALIVGAAMLMSIESQFTILGYPGLAMIFFLTAAVGGLVLVGRILFGSEE